MTDLSNIALDLNAISMQFRLELEKTSTLKEVVVNILRRKHGYKFFTALENVSLKVRRGECVGIIGRNGSGKSTLLKIIAGVLSPSQGSRSVQGRLAPLIELGAGFNGELSGRENVFLNGAILGRSRAQMKSRYDSIVDFAELGEFMDVPVKNYSSGMYARLGFAIAMDVEPDILIIDEILAVGDAPFQRKCNERIAQHTGKGGTVLLVSHDAAAVERLCNRAVMLDKGHLAFDGPASEALSRYDLIA
ncbi:MAG: ABC transporter ATP-binding protein [Clostridia bacterium]|nr:ABC transporter ATP-binding protein [Deltaproteobacteria bacterium]